MFVYTTKIDDVHAVRIGYAIINVGAGLVLALFIHTALMFPFSVSSSAGWSNLSF